MSKPKKSKRFKYQLDTLLKVREFKQRDEQDKFIEKQKQLLEEERKEKEIKEIESRKYDELLDMLNEGEMPGMNIIQMRKVNLEKVKEQVVQQEKQTKTAEKNRDAQRDNLIKAVIEKKIIQRDKEKTKEGWKKLMLKEENKFLDDISTIGFELGRRKGQEE